MTWQDPFFYESIENKGEFSHMRIFIGRAGSGKTSSLLREIGQKARENQGKQILIVPELFSHSFERRLAQATDNIGARTAEVLSFTRLTGRVFAEAGGLSDTALTPAGRLLTLQEAVRRTEANFKVYAGASQRPEIVKELLRAVDEMKGCDVPPERIFEMLTQLDAQEDKALAEKLWDLAQVYTMYNQLCQNALPDPRDALTLLAERLPQSHSFDDAELYFDGFFGFTPQEFAVIDALMAKKLKLTAAITCDSHEPDIFVSGTQTIQRLKRMAARHNIPVTVEDFGESKLARARDLAVLERELLHPAATPQTSDQSSMQIYAASDPYAECEYAAAYIRKSVQNGKARYRDFTITARDMESYAAPLEMAMARYEVPVFISEKADLLRKPPLTLVVCALQTVTNGWRYEDLFSCFKTGLCNLTLEQVDELENYALLWRIHGTAWLRAFHAHPKGFGLPFDDAANAALEQLNELRTLAITPFAQLDSSLRQAQTAGQYVQCLYAFLEQVEVPKRMMERAQAHEQAGRLQSAEEYRQLWEIIVDALEQFAWVTGDMPMDRAQFAQLFTLVLSEYDVGTIPISLDRVTCGGMERVTSENVPHLIILGVNDGILPKIPSSGGVLTENERLVLDNMGITLSATGTERLLMEQELIYRAIACPQKTLLISYHGNDASGAQARPSYLIGNIQALLQQVPLLQEAALGGSYKLYAPRPATELACAWISGLHTPAAYTAYQLYGQSAPVQRAAQQERIRGPLTSRKTIDALYGRELQMTASRVDQFYSCRFAFFMNYGLRARARRKAEFSAPEAGTFIHFVLENTLNELEQTYGSAVNAQKTDAFAVMRKYVQQYIIQVLGGLEDKPARFKYLFRRLIKTMENILENVLEELAVSDFRPVDYELAFQYDGDLPPVACSDGQVTTKLSGKVDRVDGYIKDNRLYIRVMDYKSGKKSFSLSDIWYGLNMQLVLYLQALQDEGLTRYQEQLSAELCEIVPAGMLYVPAREETLDADRDIDAETLKLLRQRALRRSGLITEDLDILEAMEHGLSGESVFLPVKLLAPKKDEQEPRFSAASSVASLAQFGKLARYAQKKLLEMGHALQKGDVRADPYQNGQQDYCQWCDFRAACQFDEAAGDSARILRNISDAEFWKENAHGDTMDTAAKASD